LLAWLLDCGADAAEDATGARGSGSDATSSVRRRQLRLCQLKRRRHSDGYGFALRIPRARVGRVIVDRVETLSPAAAAGLQRGDHLLQVGGRRRGVVVSGVRR